MSGYYLLMYIALFIKAILAPEFIAVEGLQEWAQCRRMVKDCAVLTGSEFKLVHAFYISMLALRYRTPQGDRVIWPNQYTWLLQQNLIKWDDQASWGISVKKIRDQNKTDSIARFISLIQVSWFVAQSIMRTAHALPLSQLESMTLSYIPLFTVTYFFWWHKPKDILMPSIVALPDMSEEQGHTFESMTISNKFDNEGMKDQVSYWNIWRLTPRVFEKEAEDQIRRALEQTADKASQTPIEAGTENASTDLEAIHEIRARRGKCQHSERQPIELQKEIVLSHWDPDLYSSKIWLVACLFGASFGALHLISWNTIFPTTIELWLWRTSAFVSILSLIIFMHFRKVVLRWGGPLTIISLASPVFYFVSRIIMMGQVFAALRSEDPALYDTYEVSTYWVHIL
ncbi:hypothetical protein V490_00850 [Pseudogymnoascus sp. VKM F-3557]|nr:hypothetical protein V490_00850 [Pseudogymnoascus sp. VKM F-3557]